VLRREHDELVAAVDRLDAAGLEPAAAALARDIARALWQHVDKEESVLLLESERRLIDGGVRELDPPPIGDAERRARDLLSELVRRLPPIDDPELVRGDGCIVCDAFGSECHGIETEWWSDWERMHHASLDEG
jgi:hypothetical protein